MQLDFSLTGRFWFLRLYLKRNFIAKCDMSSTETVQAYGTQGLKVAKGWINIGFGVYVNPNHVLAVMPIESAPVKRLLNASKEAETLLDGTYGRKTRSLLVFDASTEKALCGLASPLEAETVAKRMNAV